jgi:diguanylate cyclase (GGDEF)-like protein/PAS domain S-box-containing protein
MSLALESASLTERIHRRSNEARFGSLIKHSSDLITVLDADSKVIYQSPSIEGVLGYTPEEVIGTRFDRLLPIGERTRLAHLLADDEVAGNGETQVIECGLDHIDGTTRQFEILHTNLLADEHVQGIVLNSRDVSERKAFEEQLAHQAFHDPVTGLANRALFSERVRHAVSRTRRGQSALAVVFIDLDDFKTVNDSLGHTAGDQVLIQVAHRLALSTRVSDTAARFGGDEFAILLEDLDGPQEAADAAERMLESLTEPLMVEDKELYIRASVGIAIMEAGRVTDAQELIRDADVAMYMAKRDGKGTYRLFEPEMHAGVLDRLELRGDLQRALGEDQFELEYQPIVRLSDGSITGMEALVRWRHPERGLLSPDWFIPLAEETGLIVPIGNWVLEQACREATKMQRTHGSVEPLSMSVNLSLKQLQHPTVVKDVESALKRSKLEPRYLTLEITESLMMSDPELGVQRLRDLKNLGVTLAMDDFGTGYSSLSYLSRFPVDELKMDRSFLRDGETPKTSGLTAAVLALGQSLNLTIVAEGIEHHEQWMTLRDLGCELGQGFYFARPMSAAAATEFLKAHKDGRVPDFETDAGANAT